MQGFLEGTANAHHFADTFHLAPDAPFHVFELGKVPARRFDDAVVEGGLETGLGNMGNAVLDLGQGKAQRDLRGDPSQRITGGFRGEGGAAGKAGVYFDDAVVLALRVEGVLDVTLAYDAEVADHGDGDAAQFVVFAVVEGLRRGDDDALPGVHAQRVEVFHIAHGNAVVGPIPHHFVFDLFPAAEPFLDKNLVEYLRQTSADPHAAPLSKRLVAPLAQLRLVPARAAPRPAKRVGGPHHDRITDLGGGPDRGGGVGHGDAARRQNADFVQAFHKQRAVFRVLDGLHRRSEYAHFVFGQYPRAVERDPAVEGGLSAEREEESVRFFLLDDFRNKFRRYRQEVCRVRHPFARLDGGDVGVDERGGDAFFAQGFQGLGTGIVEFPGLPDFEAA